MTRSAPLPVGQLKHIGDGVAGAGIDGDVDADFLGRRAAKRQRVDQDHVAHPYPCAAAAAHRPIFPPPETTTVSDALVRPFASIA